MLGLLWQFELFTAESCDTWLDATGTESNQTQADNCEGPETRFDKIQSLKDTINSISIAYVIGKFQGSMAPIVMMTLPETYTIESHKIVLNFPHHESAMIAPKMQKK